MPAEAGVKVYPGLVHLNGHLLAAIDLETTGTRPGYHEIIQIACVPLDSDIKPLAGATPFYTVVWLYSARGGPSRFPEKTTYFSPCGA
jgi:hypothetical protein